MGDILDGMIQDGLLDMPDPFDHDDDSEWGGHQPPQPRCRYCGSTSVRWRQQGGRWVLFSLKPGIVHQCDVINEFEVQP